MENELRKDDYNSIGSLNLGFDTRKFSVASLSNYSTISTNTRKGVTENKPFPLSRSNSRRTKDVLKVQIDSQIK